MISLKFWENSQISISFCSYISRDWFFQHFFFFLAPWSVWNKSTKLSNIQSGNGISKARSHQRPIDNLHQQSLVSPAAAVAFTLTAAPAGRTRRRRRESFCSIRLGTFGDDVKRIVLPLLGVFNNITNILGTLRFSFNLCWFFLNC